MKYTRSNGDWVELEGAHELTMREYTAIWSGDQAAARNTVAALLVNCHFANKRRVLDGKLTPDDLFDLTMKQWDWLRGRVGEATRDNDLDPE